jgi:branched-chain amino acid transport system substrate-binding protein
MIPTMRICARRFARGLTTIAVAAFALSLGGAHAQQGPIRIGLGISQSGGVAPAGKQLLVAIQLWRDDVNAKGGLLGRQIDLVVYDDQSNPSNVPGIYTKMIDVDKVDLLLGPYATNMVAPAIPVVMQHDKLTIGMMALAANSQFHYNKYFSMLPMGPDPKSAMSEGFFEVAKRANPAPKTVAIVAADAEFAQNAADGARINAKKFGLNIVYDKSYPPPTQDFAPIVRAVQAANPDIVFQGAYPPDTVGFIRAMNEIGFKPKMYGGAPVGLFITPIKMQLGPLVNGAVVVESFLNAPTLEFPGLRDVMKRYQETAKTAGTDLIGYGFVPFGYGAGQVLAAGVEGCKCLNHDKIADFIRSNEIATIAGNVRYGKDGEWAEARTITTQFQGVEKTGDVSEFTDPKKEIVVWPDKFKTGEMLYPMEKAQAKK